MQRVKLASGSGLSRIPGTQGFPAALRGCPLPVAWARWVPTAPAVGSSDSAQAERLFWGCKGLFEQRGFFLLLAGSFAEVRSTLTRGSPSAAGPRRLMSDGSQQVESPFSTSMDSFFHSQWWKTAQSVPVRSWLS